MTDSATISYARCDLCGTFGDPDARHRCARLAPRALPDRAHEPAYVRLAHVDARIVGDVVLVWDAARDLERLAAPAVQRFYYGRGVAIEPSVRGTGSADGPLDHLPARQRAELHAIHNRFESLRRCGCGGSRHADPSDREERDRRCSLRLSYQVLHYAFLDHGPTQRHMPAAIARLATKEAAVVPNGPLTEDFLFALGCAFTRAETRAKWRTNREVSLRRQMPCAFARKIFAAAVAAYETEVVTERRSMT